MGLLNDRNSLDNLDCLCKNRGGENGCECQNRGGPDNCLCKNRGGENGCECGNEKQSVEEKLSLLMKAVELLLLEVRDIKKHFRS